MQPSKFRADVNVIGMPLTTSATTYSIAASVSSQEHHYVGSPRLAAEST